MTFFLCGKEQVSFRLYAQLGRILSFSFAYYLTKALNKV